jgi:hypothetical protein
MNGPTVSRPDEPDRATPAKTLDHMTASDETPSEPASNVRGDERVLSWRHASLLPAGYDHRLAFQLALCSAVDLCVPWPAPSSREGKQAP